MVLDNTDCRRGSILGHMGREIFVRVVYSDETEAGPITVITALVINMDKHWPRIERELEAIKADTPTALLHNGQELKGSKLYGTVQQVQRLRATNKPIDPDLEKARDLLFKILAVPIRYPTPIFYGAVDKAGYEVYSTRSPTLLSEHMMQISKRRTLTLTGLESGLPAPPKSKKKATAHDVAFDSCLARINAAAESFLEEGEQVLWIHDHRGNPKQELQTKTGPYWARYLVEHGWDPVNLAYAGEQEPLRVADSIYFGHSHESLALQLVDVCCWTIGRHILENMYNWKWPFVAPYYAVIQRRVMNDGTPPMYRGWADTKDG